MEPRRAAPPPRDPPRHARGGFVHPPSPLQGSGGETEAQNGAGAAGGGVPQILAVPPGPSAPSLEMLPQRSQHAEEGARLPVCPVQPSPCRTAPKSPEHPRAMVQGVGEDLPGGGRSPPRGTSNRFWVLPGLFLAGEQQKFGGMGARGALPPPSQAGGCSRAAPSPQGLFCLGRGLAGTPPP